jgi:hypothetical protein
MRGGVSPWRCSMMLAEELEPYAHVAPYARGINESCRREGTGAGYDCYRESSQSFPKRSLTITWLGP